ncbi:APC family permease [Picrophilus oshimae]|uniref:Amino acid/polyamine/organocation transporter, APC superfamily n=1 Tax=Picrophilus torridus (strain ATCC 700027 / DSM 9790 / JCM 10055 / NBRC 100828 / KAW 2/3) TaxID=1122961 RepID=A0A8G2FY34_PICTO|nr:APC family permease [Picrophilus oshimae]SMD31681.1 amino acid/polyamine/organocation transporter, APC superfamily [Picrophilus oshimae DSM 9789]
MIENNNTIKSNIHGRKPRLRKDLTFNQMLMIGLVGSFGNGALFDTVVMVAGAGPEAILAFVLGAIIYASIGVSYMELARVYPEAGGPTRYTIYTHGRWTNIINAISDIIWYIFIPPIEVIAIIAGLNYFDPIFLTATGAPTYYGVGIGLALMLALIPFNYYGVKQFGRSSLYTGIVKLFFYLSMSLGLIFFVFAYKNLYAYHGFFPYGATSIFAIMPYAMYDFGAIRVIPDLAEETNMKEKIPRAIALVMLFETLIYISVAFAVLMGTKWSALGIIPGHFDDIVTAFHGDNPFFIMGRQSGFIYIFIAAVITGFLAPFVTGYIYLGSGTRVLFSMGRSGYISKSLKTIDKKHNIPLVSLIIFAVVGTFLVFVTAPDPSIYTFIDDATAAGYIGLIATPIALMVSRRQGITRKKDMVRGMGIIAPLATGASGLIVFWTGWPSEPYAVILIAAGAIIFGIWSRVKIGAKNVLWYILFIAFATFMVATSHDGLSSSVFPQFFSYIDGTVITFLVGVFIIYPLGVYSGFKKQFVHREFTEEIYSEEKEMEWKNSQ